MRLPVLLMGLACGSALAATSSFVIPQPNPAMKAVLDELGATNPPPIDKQEPRVARDEPSPTDAVMSLLSKRGKPTVQQGVSISHKVIPGPGGDLLLRIYSPKNAGPSLPVLVYFHGGGWVIANLNTYDPSCRVLSFMAHCMVISVAYRLAPENKFPAAHDDAYAATKWVMDNTASIGGDPNRVAIGGESAGGNLAVATALHLKRDGAKLPIYELAVYPIAGYDFNTPSYQENGDAKPLNKPMMQWFFHHYLNSADEGMNDYISFDQAKDLAGMPPTTIILAEIDPLRSEGQMLGDRLNAAGVQTEVHLYRGVTHEFFGMGAVVPEAKDAEMLAAQRLKAAFSK